MHHHDQTDQRREYLKFAALNIAILLLSNVLTFLLIEAPSLSDGMRIYMALVWLVYASFQLIGYEMFVHAFRGYDIIARRFPAYAYAFPFIELGWSSMYAADLFPLFRDLSVVVLMGIGVYGIWSTLQKKTAVVECACLGAIIKLPLSRTTLYEDAVMGTMAALMLIMRI